MIPFFFALTLLATPFDLGMQPTLASSVPKQKYPLIIENLNNGSYLKLSDNSFWNIRPQDTLISQGWITEVEIIITPSGDPDYPSKLTNSLSKSSVFARRVNAVPNVAPATPPLPPSK